MTPEATAQQIRDIINALMVASLVNHQKYPVCRKTGQQTAVMIEGSPDLSASMKNMPYEDVYKNLREAGSYHLQMIDGALLQLLYSFDRNKLVSHRLAYFPSPLLESYDEAAEFYNYEPLFADIFSTITIRAPIRFDYSSSDEEYVDVDHPRSHLTIGQNKGCRIPVNSPLTPLRFIRFILRSFYSPAYVDFNFDVRAMETGYPESISLNERKILHVIA